MAYMNQDKKAVIAAELKKIMPTDCKYTLRVRDHMTLVMTIREGNIDFIGAAIARFEEERRQAHGNERLVKNLGEHIRVLQENGYIQVNHYRPDSHFSGEVLALVQRIIACLNTGNWDKSDIQSDYVDVGHYIDLHIGDWDSPYRHTGKASTQQAA